MAVLRQCDAQLHQAAECTRDTLEEGRAGRPQLGHEHRDLRTELPGPNGPIPVLGVPVPTRHLAGQDSLYSIVQMPAGIPVGTLAIGKAGAINAALLAASVLALNDPPLAARLAAWRKQQTESVAERPEGSA